MIGITIDYKKTKIEVEKFFNDYEMLKFRYEDALLPKMTSQNSLVYSKPTGRPKSKTEAAVECRDRIAKELDELIKNMVNAYNRLTSHEREFMNYKFFSSIKYTDDDIMYKLNLTRYSFFDLKKTSYKKFALAMNIEIYEEQKAKHRK